MFDDPLSAVDANVGEHIFEKCFVEALQGTTRVLVMNQLHFLPQCDYIYVLDAGSIVAEGTYKQLTQTSQVFQELMQSHDKELAGASAPEAKDDRLELRYSASLVADDDDDEDRLNDVLKSPAPAPPSAVQSPLDGPPQGGIRNLVVEQQGRDGVRKPEALTDVRTPIPTEHGTEADTKVAAAGDGMEANQQVQEEEVQSGQVGLKVFLLHFSHMGVWIIPFFVTAIIAQGLITGSAFVLSWWTSNKFHRTALWYITLYGLVGVAGGLLIVVRGWFFALGTTRACRLYHEELFLKVLRAPSVFYDVTPVGRVLNRFTKDMSDIDTQLPRFLQSSLNICFFILGALVSTAVVTPIFLTAIFGVGFSFVMLQRYYSRSCTQLKRIESVTRSPVYNHFSETLLGLSTIRAFGISENFKEINVNYINTTGQALYCVRMVLQWASVRIGVLNALLLFFAALFVAIEKDSGKGKSAGNAAVAVYFVLQIGPLMGFLIQNMTELENVMNSVERVDFYCREMEQEPDWDRNELVVPSSWPSLGKIDFEGLTFAYREGLAPVLKNFTASIKSQETVGVAGRTGSGKSSLMLCLFRMYELTTGRILIDGIDIAKIGLHTLRKKLAIIPQDPVIFSGTVRFNLDPFEEYSEKDCWHALEQVQLKSFVEKNLGGLSGGVKEFGNNLSVGQRQLLCIARAILRKPTILVMDEATSSVDTTTDALIQAAVRTQFKQCTIMTIAHRLNTIMDSNRVLVLDKGVLAEFDEPWTLVHREGLLSSMYKAMTKSHAIQDPHTEADDMVHFQSAS
eukprot:gb/GEZN01000127.1/.p1 GENE.gb/GEZN01000127.1/~~gb/GEZN01000127.1/.p1  ORF type:complete len:795 (-),score=98.70 gb/GEZN01000127.1/:2430-4814(-)